MENKTLIVLVMLFIGLFIGYLVGVNRTDARYANLPNGMHVMQGGHMMNNSLMIGDMDDQMSGMMVGLEGKTGDAFDEAFLSEMIIHHKGAVEMAQAALQNANHLEIKNMANDIISAQTSEIVQMGNWLKSWYNK